MHFILDAFLAVGLTNDDLIIHILTQSLTNLLILEHKEQPLIPVTLRHLIIGVLKHDFFMTNLTFFFDKFVQFGQFTHFLNTIFDNFDIF